MTAVIGSVRDRLLANHQRLEALLERQCAATAAQDGDEALRLWAEVESGVLMHLEAEEAYLIPTLLRSSERDARALARELCHIRARLTEVRPCTGSRAARTSSVPDFVHELRAHVHSADRIILRWADSHLEDPGRASVIDVLLDKHTANKQAL